MRNFIIIVGLMLFLLCKECSNVMPCKARNYGFSSFVCVCDVSNCDTLDPVSVPPKGQAALYESDKFQNRFKKSVLQFTSTVTPGTMVLQVNRSERYQFILGFGGAFTDSAGINIASLPLKLQSAIIDGYYSANGLDYSIGRIPMASCDFSTNVYSYDEVPDDFSLQHFYLAMEDFKYKIPYIRMAQSISKKNLLFLGSPWSAPAWMKTNNHMNGSGTIKGKPGGKYYQVWADYFVRFVQEYEKENITLWGLTAQNEPTVGFIANFSYQATGFTPETQRDFIKLNLGPTLQKAGFGPEQLKLMIMDDQRVLLPKWADVVLKDADAAQYVSGIAFHWYLNYIAPPSLLDITHDHFPNTFLLSTEACTGSKPWDIKKVILGSWERAELYAHDIIQDLLHWSIGWIDWNLALDTSGGPNWAKNFVDSPIIVNATNEEFYHQPMFYAIAHFSKLLPPGSIRIGFKAVNTTTTVPKAFELLDIAAFLTPLDATVIIIVNSQDVTVPVVIQDAKVGYLSITIHPRSIQSYIWYSK